MRFVGSIFQLLALLALGLVLYDLVYLNVTQMVFRLREVREVTPGFATVKTWLPAESIAHLPAAAVYALLAVVFHGASWAALFFARERKIFY